MRKSPPEGDGGSKSKERHKKDFQKTEFPFLQDNKKI